MTPEIIPEPETPTPDLGSLPVLYVLLYSFATMGIYMPIWVLNRREALNKLDSKVKLDKVDIYAVIVAFVMSLLLMLAVISTEASDPELSKRLEFGEQILNLACAFLMLILSFRVRAILEEHFKTRFSVLYTFLIGIYFLQYRINKLQEKKA